MLHSFVNLVRRLQPQNLEASHAQDTFLDGELGAFSTATPHRLGEGMTHISGDSLSSGTPKRGPSMGSSSSTDRGPKTIAGGDLYPRHDAVHPAMQQLSGHPIMQFTQADDDLDVTSNASDDVLDMSSLTRDTEQFFLQHFSRIVEEGKVQLPAMIRKAASRRTQGRKAARDEALQQARTEAEAKQKELARSFQKQLQQKEAELQSVNKKLMNCSGQCSSLQAALNNKMEHLAAVEAQMVVKNKECGMLHEALDEKDFELESVKSKGKELLTFQGLTTPAADVSSLKVALRDLSEQLQKFAEVTHGRKFASPWVPHLVDIQGMKQQQQGLSQLSTCGIKHTALLVLAAVVFGNFECKNSFYHSDLAVMAGSCVGDQECTVLQLQLEQKVANHWLQSFHPWSANNSFSSSISSSTSADTAALDNYTGLFMSTLMTGETMKWNQSVDPTEVLTPAARRLVAAAIRVQVIAAAMHTRLIRICVPGWRPSWCPGATQGQHSAARTDAAAPHSWASWPGVVPLNKDLMQPGVRLLASQARGVFDGDCPDVAVVFCQEPAVVQVAERVGDLCESEGTRQQHSGPRSPYKGLIKARMAVAAR